MQTLKKNLLVNNLKKNFLNFQKAHFSQPWATNSTTGEATARHISLAPKGFNGWTCFNKNKVPSRARIDHAIKNQTKDFPALGSRLDFLTGQSK